MAKIAVRTLEEKAMRCWIDLSASALRHNYRLFSQLSSPAQLIPIIKSNAYGHGLEEIFNIIATENPPWLGVNYLDEAALLRDLGYQGHILVVGPIAFDRHPYASSLGVDIFIGDQPSLEAWLQVPETTRPRVHIKFDTGMGRQGFDCEKAQHIATSLSPYRDKIVGVCSHFANVEDVVNHQYADHQLSQFVNIKKIFSRHGYRLLAHMASSASTLIMKNAALDMTRVGISMYGLWPSQTTRVSFLQVFDHLEELRPVLSWKTEIAVIKQVQEGSYIGYGCSFRAIATMTIAVLPIGYYEGYPRIASGRGSYVLVKGRRCPIVGRICMNMMMIDISHIEDVKVGDAVTLIGQDGDEYIAAEELGRWCETIHYEVVTCLNPRIPRRIQD